MRAFRYPCAAAALAAFASPVFAQYPMIDHNGNSSGLLGVDDAEFTPDGSKVVIRDNTNNTSCRVYDASTGLELFAFAPQVGTTMGGPSEDAVVCTNDYAVVIGTTAMFLDLNNLAGSPYAVFDFGGNSRDVAMSPDGLVVAVRADLNMYLFDTFSGAVLASQAGAAPVWSAGAFEVDSVVITNDHAVFTSYTPAGSTRVTIWDLYPTGGGPPAVVFETTAATDLGGMPHDLALTPNGQYVAVRSDDDLGLYQLSGASSGPVWVQQAAKGQGDPFGASAMDSVVVTDTMVATISRRTSSGSGAHLDVWDIPTGTNHWNLLKGDPHDLERTPNGQRLVVRTHQRVYLFDVSGLGGGGLLVPLAEEKLTGNFTSWQAGLDSLFVTDDRVLAISRLNLASKVRVYDISASLLTKVYGSLLDEVATDVAITPNGHHAVITGITAGLVVDLRLNQATLLHNPYNTGIIPWCDGVAVTNDKAVVFGAECCNTVASGGWIAFIDLFSRATNYCTSNPNSTQRAATIVASRSSRFGSNDLVLTALDVPPGQFGRFIYGDLQQQIPWADGFLCLQGQVAGFPVQVTGSDFRAEVFVDNQNLPPGGGALLSGSTWNFQFVYRDRPSVTGANSTDAVSVLFE